VATPPALVRALVFAGNAPLADAAKIQTRFSALSLPTAFLSSASLEYRLDPMRGQQFFQRMTGELSAVGSNRDAVPAGLDAALRYWQAIFAPGIARFYAWFMRFSWLLWVVAFLWFFSGKAGYTGTAFISGAAAMGLQMISMWGLQVARGSIYFWAGLLTAAFMAGAAAGSLIVCQRYLGDCTKRRLAGMELLFFLWTAAGFLLVKLAGSAWPVFFAFSFGSGLLLGLEFPVLTLLKTHSTGSNASAAAGMMYAADLLGGWLAALVVGALLLPLWGISRTLLFILLLKATSLRWALTARSG
jgi:spermidine synthase